MNRGSAAVLSIDCAQTIDLGGARVILEKDLRCEDDPFDGPILRVIGPGTLDLAGHTLACDDPTEDGPWVEGRRARIVGGSIGGCRDAVVLGGDGLDVGRFGALTGYDNLLHHNVATGSGATTRARFSSRPRAGIPEPMSAGEPAPGAIESNGDPYAEYRAGLLRTEVWRASLVMLLVSLAYLASEAITDPGDVVKDLGRQVLLVVVPLVALWLAHRAPQGRIEWVVLGFDLAYTSLIAIAPLWPQHTASGAALLLSLKMVATALLLRWNPRRQLVSAMATLAIFFAVLSAISEPGDHLPLHLFLGPVFGAFFSVLGATHLDRIHRALFLQNRQLREANLLQAEFVANVSHELRTPLNVINGYLDVLTDPGLLATDEARDIVGRIRRSASVLTRLVTNVLEYARLERGHAIVYPTRFSLPQLLDDLRALCREAGASEDVELVIAGGPDVELFTDYDRLYSTLSNLLLNALKFTRAGRIELATRRLDDTIEFRVTDTGIGIAPEQLGQIFEPFRQVDGSPSRTFEGVGLGLSIVRRNVALLHGDLQVQSRLGEGTLFTVRLPMQIQASAWEHPLRSG